MTLGLNREGTRQKYTYQKRLTNRSLKVGVDYAARIHLLKEPKQTISKQNIPWNIQLCVILPFILHHKIFSLSKRLLVNMSQKNKL